MPTSETGAKTLRLFFSYAHEDKKFRNELQVHLSGLKKRGIISDWYDGGITAGSDWSKEISGNLEAAQIILLLISPDFINSEYCYDYEMKRALEKHEAGEARVIPVLIRDLDDWASFPFAKLQVVPQDATPVEKWSNQNEAWVDVARNIRLACKEMLEMRQAAETVEQVETIRKISVDVPVGEAAGALGGQSSVDLRAGDAPDSGVERLLKKAVLLHAEAEEASLDNQLPEDQRKAAYIAKLKEAYDLLREANESDPINTEVLLQMAQLLVELTPDDPNDEKKLLNRIRKLLSEPKSDAESFRLARATYMLAMSGRPPQVDLLREPRTIFERLGRVEWVQQCDRVLAEVKPPAAEASKKKKKPKAEHNLPPESGTKTAPPPADFQPTGQWQFQVNDQLGSVLHLNFNADGSFYGSQVLTATGVNFQLNGYWNYTPFNRVLQIGGQAVGLPNQFLLGITIQAPQGDGFHGFGTDGCAYFITRGGSAPQPDFGQNFGGDFDLSDFGL